MFAPVTLSCGNPSGSATTRHLEGTIVETTYVGHASGELLQQVADFAPTVFAAVPGVCWLVDASAITAVDAGAREPGASIFKLFRESKGRGFSFLLQPQHTASIAARSMIRTVAVLSRVDIHIADTREDALVHLRALQRKAR